MAFYSEASGQTLLSGASDLDGDTITVRRINGSVIDWTTSPHVVTMTTGGVRIWNDGTVQYDDEGSTSGHPIGGGTVANGSFTFTLWDGMDESPAYTCDISLSALLQTNEAPVGENHTLQYDVTAP